MENNKIIIPLFIAIGAILFEYLIIQPLMGSGCGSFFLLMIVLAFLAYEYYSEKFFPKLGFTKFRDYVDEVIFIVSKLSSHFFSEISLTAKELAKLFASILVALTLIFTFTFDFSFQYLNANIEVIQDWIGTSIPINTFISALFFISYLFIMIVLGFLENRFCKVSRLIVTACAIILLIHSYIPYIEKEYKLSGEQIALVYISIVLIVIWVVAWIILTRHDEKYRKLNDAFTLLSSLPEISDMLNKESQRLTKKFQQGWQSFVNDPWSDGYVDSIKNCVPVKCEGYLLTIGYVTDLERIILDDVQFALKQDLQNYFDVPNLEIHFKKIGNEQHRKILNLLDEQSND